MLTQALIDQALALPIPERIALADLLLESISDEHTVCEPHTAIALALKRLAEIENGTVKMRTHDELMQAARMALGSE